VEVILIYFLNLCITFICVCLIGYVVTICTRTISKNYRKPQPYAIEHLEQKLKEWNEEKITNKHGMQYIADRTIKVLEDEKAYTLRNK
jgi:Na+/phosphate symporter